MPRRHISPASRAVIISNKTKSYIFLILYSICSTKSSLSIENKFDLGIDDILKDDLKPENEVEKIKEKFAKVNEDKALEKKEEKFSLKNSEDIK